MAKKVQARRWGRKARGRWLGRAIRPHRRRLGCPPGVARGKRCGRFEYYPLRPVAARKHRRNTRGRWYRRHLKRASAPVRSPYATSIVELLDLALDDDDAVESFCEKRKWLTHMHQDGMNISYPANLLHEVFPLTERRKRLKIAKKIVESVATTLMWGGAEGWARLEAALSAHDAPKSPHLMALRANVVEEVLTSRPRYRKVLLPEHRRMAVTTLQIRLGLISHAFNRLDPKKTVEVLEQKNTATMRAAKLSVSVNAFGDGGRTDREVETLFARAWKRQCQSKGVPETPSPLATSASLKHAADASTKATADASPTEHTGAPSTPNGASGEPFKKAASRTKRQS